MPSKQPYSTLACEGFLARAFRWLRSGVDTDLFYAALELRFTFEKLLIKHGNASTNYTNSFLKLNWEPKKLRNHLIAEFTPRLDITKSYQFTLDPGNPALTMGYFLTIPDELFGSYGRLDRYLHAQWAIRIGTPDRAWYQETSTFLHEFAQQLIPHASSKNSLDFFSIPNIQAREIDSQELEQLLRRTLPEIEK